MKSKIQRYIKQMKLIMVQNPKTPDLKTDDSGHIPECKLHECRYLLVHKKISL